MPIDTSKRISHRDLMTPVGEFITPFEFDIVPEAKVEDVLHTLQTKRTHQKPDYFYITNSDNVLVGIISKKDLLYNPPDTLIEEIQDSDVIKVQESDTLAKALHTLAEHQIVAIPVVNEDNRLVGYLEILHQDHADLAKSRRKIEQKHVREEIFQFIGFTIEQGKFSSSWDEFRFRMPWLACNLLGGLICAVIAQVFQVTLIEFVVLALFIPLVLTLSESIGIQSMTLSLRFLHIRRIHWLQVWRRLYVEWKASALLALACAVIIAIFYFVWSTDIKPIFAIGTSLLVAMVASATFGALFPILLHALRLDPKVAAGPVVLMMADIVTVTIYLSLSSALLT